MPCIKPWDKKSEEILRRLTKRERAYTKDVSIPRAFGRRHPELIDNGFLEIARIDRKKQTVFLRGEDTIIFPKKGKYFFERL